MNGSKALQASRAVTGVGSTRAHVSESTGSPEPMRTIPAEFGEADAALAELEQRWQSLLARIEMPLLSPAPPMGEAKKEVDQPASQIALRLREFTQRVAFVADSIEHATARLEI